MCHSAFLPDRGFRGARSSGCKSQKRTKIQELEEIQACKGFGEAFITSCMTSDSRVACSGSEGSWWELTDGQGHRTVCPVECLIVCRAGVRMSLFRDLSLTPMCIQTQPTSFAGQPQRLGRRTHQIWTPFHPLWKNSFHHMPSCVRETAPRSCLHYEEGIVLSSPLGLHISLLLLQLQIKGMKEGSGPCAGESTSAPRFPEV